MIEPVYTYEKGKGWVRGYYNRVKDRTGGFLILEHRLPEPGEYYLKLSKVYDKYYLNEKQDPNWETVCCNYEGSALHDFDLAYANQPYNTHSVYIVVSK